MEAGLGEVEQGAGFRVRRRPDAPPVLTIGEWTDAVERVLAATPAVVVTIEGRYAGTLDPLVPFAEHVRGLIVKEGYAGKLHPANRLARLESLSLEIAPRGVDLSSFPGLRRCTLAGAGEVAGMDAAAELEELVLERGKVETLRGLAPLRRLRKLHLEGMSRLVSLEGIEGLPIEDLTVIRARALRSVGAAASLPRLRALELEGVRAVEDFERLAGTATLEELSLYSGPSLPDYGFLRGMTRLRRLAMGSTEVGAGADGIAPLEALTELRLLLLDSGLKHLGALDGLGRLVHLERLSIDNAGEVRSIGFVRSLTELQNLWISRTRIADRDLSPLLELKKLREASISPEHKQYAPPVAEVLAALRANHREFHEARERRIQDARLAVNPHAHTAPPAAPPAPAPGVLAGIPWRLDEEVADRDGLVRRVREQRPGWNADELVLPAPRIRVRVPDEVPVELASDAPHGFTAAELLFKVHHAAAPLVRDTDHRYFEGLVPAPDSGGVPLYDIRLGS